jgi:predicted hydrocarbon binding protein
MYSPGKHIFHVVFANKDPMKGFEAASLIVKKFKLTLLDARYTKRGKEGDDWSIFLQDGVTGVKKEEIRRELLSVEGMAYVRVNEDADGLALDLFHFPLRDPGGERAYVISAESLGAVFDKMRELFGTGGEVVIFEEGETVGAKEVEELTKMVGRDNIVPLLPNLPFLLQVTGVGRPEIVSMDLERLDVVFRIYDCVECEHRISSVPYSRWIKGMLVGFMSTLFERPCRAEETKCIAMGDRYCEFIIHAA